MTIDTDDLINSIMASFDRVNFIKTEDIPNIDMYMDQVTTFMDRQLKNTTRNKEEDKVLTKTMINNYAKNNLLPAPEKHKYSKEHMIVLIFIYYFKNILSINDIQMLLDPLTEKYFGNDNNLSVVEIYDKVSSYGASQVEELKNDVKKKFATSKEIFTDSAKEDQEFLQMFSFICLLSFDVYSKKLLIEKMLDDYSAKHPDAKLSAGGSKKKVKKETRKETKKESKREVKRETKLSNKK